MQKPQRDIARRILGVIFLVVWLSIYIAERLEIIAHGTADIWHQTKDLLPLVVGLALFAPDAGIFVRDFIIGWRKKNDT